LKQHYLWPALVHSDFILGCKKGNEEAIDYSQLLSPTQCQTPHPTPPDHTECDFSFAIADDSEFSHLGALGVSLSNRRSFSEND
jgi:hypothetical protein